MTTTKKYLAAAAALLCLLAVSLPNANGQTLPWSRQTQQPKVDPADPVVQLQKFNQFYRLVSAGYVDTVNYVKLVEDAIQGSLDGLDPHSAYISAEDMKEVSISMEGSFSGIGIEFNVLKDTIIIVNTIPGGPSERLGVMPNDRIVEIDGVSAIGMKQNQVPEKLRGKRGTIVEIKVLRHGESEPLSFRITRDNIPVNTVDAAYVIAPKTGYIKINRFAHNTMSEFEKTFAGLGKIDGLILDLRGNGGGLLDQAVLLSGFFLPEGCVVVSTEGLRVPPERYTVKKNGKFLKGKVIVLIDESSASASEIVAGAIQDWDRGVVIGRRSFGKGLVQRQFPFADGSALRLTVAHYHTPTGRDIQRPYKLGQTKAYYEELIERIGSPSDSIAGGDSLKYKTLKLQKDVYGGGGIYPDIYTQADTTDYSPYWAKLVRRGAMNEWVITYLDQNRSALTARYPDFNSFMAGFEMDSTMVNGLVALGETHGVPYDEKGMETSGQAIRLQVKASIAQRLYDRGDYYRVINAANPDPTLRRALKLLDDWAAESPKFVAKGY